ncbi:MAG: ABC transporter transmembrane domain-containing protein, partial [Rhizomicrobium sp.]
MRHVSEAGGGEPSIRPLFMLLPYLWPKGRRDLKIRVLISVFCMILAKVATVYIPVFFGRTVDSLSVSPALIVLSVPLTMVIAYTIARIAMQGFAQLRDGIFAPVAYHALREVGVQTFAHVHTLSLRFHLERKTGGLSRAIERGTRGIDTLLGFAIFSIFPTILELALVTIIMLYKFDLWFAVVTVGMVV